MREKLNHLLDVVPVATETEDEEESLDQKSLIEGVSSVTKQLKETVNDTNKKINDTYQEQLDTVTGMINDHGLWKTSQKFEFSNTLKHPNVQIVNPKLCKAGGTVANYKFCLLEPSLQAKGNKKHTFAFKMKVVNSSNWIAVGMCHKNIIVQKNYNFTFSSLGHGA